MFKNLSPEVLGITGRQSEIIEMALSFGFRGIDLDIAEVADQVTERGPAHARRLLDSAKLRIGCFSLPVDWRGDDEAFEPALAQLGPLAAAAAEVGATRCVTEIKPACALRPYHQNFEFHRQRLSAIARRLEPSGIQLGLEFLAPADRRQGKAFEFIHDLDSLLVLVSSIAAPNVGVVLDLWEAEASGGSIDVVRRKLKARQVVAVRVADAPKEVPRHEWRVTSRLLPGETGVIDTPAALVALAELGYDGPVTPAPHSSRFAGARRDAIVKQAGEKLNLVWKAAGLGPSGKLAAAAGRLYRG